LRLPHEAALARVVNGVAARAAGDSDGGQLELEAAYRALVELGATSDAERVESLLHTTGAERPCGLTAREVEVLRLVAAGKTNREIAREMYLSEHTVSRHLQNMFTKLDVSSRAAATAFAYQHELV
jgi:DNA-binding NarL/FixJ family response regulator